MFNVLHRRPGRILALLLVSALTAASCGGGSPKAIDGEVEVGDPVRGRSVTYALEAETGDGWCLPEAQLAISGIVVARAIYDTLTTQNADGEYVPYLAKEVTPNDDYTAWTITLREGVTFHDGSPLTAEVVQDNLNAYRGVVGSAAVPPSERTPHPVRKPQLFLFVLDNIDDVQVTGDLEVTVTTKTPWVAFPAFLHSSGRLGIVGTAQLHDPDTCDRNLIGTGPFQLVDWAPGRELTAKAFPDYWQTAPDGKPYPYLDEIKFQPMIEPEMRINALESGTIDLLHASGAQDFHRLRDLKERGVVGLDESEDFAEVTFVQMNTSRPPMNDPNIRRAAALSVDWAEFTEQINQGLFTLASGPFAPGSIGYLEDAGFPREQDLEEARRLVSEYEAANGPIEITYQATPGQATQQIATYVEQRMKDIGVDLRVELVQQDKLISNAIAGTYDVMGFRNYPGGDPDELYVWFHSSSAVNFARINDPDIDRLLEAGRVEADPETRAGIYQDLNREFGKDIYAIWANWTAWAVAGQAGVHGYEREHQPALPNGDRPSTGLATGHPLHGIWVQS